MLVAGALPFALLGLAVGFLASANATPAILHAVLIPSAVASGLWMPLELLPAPIQAVAPVLPTYHLAQLALAQLNVCSAATTTVPRCTAADSAPSSRSSTGRPAPSAPTAAAIAVGSGMAAMVTAVAPYPRWAGRTARSGC